MDLGWADPHSEKPWILILIDISFYAAKMDSIDKAKPSVRVGRKATGLEVPIGI